MKLTIEIGQDEELRKEILHMIAVEIRKITGDEIKKMALDYLSQVNVAAKITSTIKDVLNRQIDFIVRGYGDVVIKQELEKKFSDWIEQNFQTYFNTNVKAFIKAYLEDKASTFSEFLDLLRKNKK